MADRLREMKKSGSRARTSKGSMTHIGATPYRFRIEIFVSYADKVKNVSDVCVTWERRGSTQATNVVKVKEGKAIFKQSMSMESTLFRRVSNGKGVPSSGQEELKFDEKKAKVVLRKGSSTGKSVGKIHLNIADYVRGPTSTVFADMKLSNDSIIVTRIEATMLHMGKKKKNDSRAGSEACSEMTDANSMDEDSLFGDDDADLGDLEIEATRAPMEDKNSGISALSPVSSTSASSAIGTSGVTSAKSNEASRNVPTAETSESHAKKGKPTSSKVNPGTGPSSDLPRPNKKSSQRALNSDRGEEELTESPSLRLKLKKKMKTKKRDKDSSKGDGETSTNVLPPRSPENTAQIAELKNLVESLKKENAKLRSSKQAAMDEIEALRTDLEACEESLESDSRAASETRGTLDMSKTLKEKDKTIAVLEAQNESLLEELEELHEATVNSGGGADSSKLTSLKRQIEDLEVALRREPQYMDVVNELKVTKVSLALANMEKEQALFALQTHCAQQLSNNN